MVSLGLWKLEPAAEEPKAISPRDSSPTGDLQADKSHQKSLKKAPKLGPLKDLNEHHQLDLFSWQLPLQIFLISFLSLPEWLSSTLSILNGRILEDSIIYAFLDLL